MCIEAEVIIACTEESSCVVFVCVSSEFLWFSSKYFLSLGCNCCICCLLMGFVLVLCWVGWITWSRLAGCGFAKLDGPAGDSDAGGSALGTVTMVGGGDWSWEFSSPAVGLGVLGSSSVIVACASSASSASSDSSAGGSGMNALGGSDSRSSCTDICEYVLAVCASRA